MATEATAPIPTPPERVLAIDAYRGLVMLAMVSHGLGFRHIAQHYTDSPVWQTLGYQFDHVPWIGVTFWDLIQPSFMFLVGVALAYSVARRAESGQSFAQMLLHAIWRAVLLVLLGVFLRSNTTPQTNWMFTDVTSQIGLGYVFLFLLSFARPWVQAAAAAVVLVGYWALFAFWPLPPTGFDYASVGLPPDWRHLPGFEQHWDKNTNAAAAFDAWFMNLFPREKPFLFERGGYQTLNFIPSLATMIFGLLAGQWLRTGRTGWQKVGGIVLAGCAALGLGLAIHELGLCPIVKRIWTPSWAIYAAGWTCLMLGAFYAVTEVIRLRAWTFPLVVAGANSIAIYCMSYLLPSWIDRTLKCHLGPDIYQLKLFGSSSLLTAMGLPAEVFAPLVRSLVILLCLWLVCLWMYRRKIFLKI